MSPRLHHRPRLDFCGYLFPLLAILLQGREEGLVFFFGPAAGVFLAGFYDFLIGAAGCYCCCCDNGGCGGLWVGVCCCCCGCCCNCCCCCRCRHDRWKAVHVNVCMRWRRRIGRLRREWVGRRLRDGHLRDGRNFGVAQARGDILDCGGMAGWVGGRLVHGALQQSNGKKNRARVRDLIAVKGEWRWV